MNKQENKEYYRVVAGAQTRDPYPVYKFYNDPEDWHCNGTVKISCKDGKVDVTIFEKDSINVHQLTAIGPARLTAQLQHPEKP